MQVITYTEMFCDNIILFFDSLNKNPELDLNKYISSYYKSIIFKKIIEVKAEKDPPTLLKHKCKLAADFFNAISASVGNETFNDHPILTPFDKEYTYIIWHCNKVMYNDLINRYSMRTNSFLF